VSDRRQRFDEFEQKLGRLISDYADILAPRDCQICARDDSCPHTPEQTGVAVPGVMYQDFLLVHRWSRLDGAGGYWDWVTADGLLMVESIGVLQVCLDDARDQVRRQR
jgi:hypothetical protein